MDIQQTNWREQGWTNQIVPGGGLDHVSGHLVNIQMYFPVVNVDVNDIS